MGCSLSAIRGKKMSVQPIEMSHDIDRKQNLFDNFQTATFGVACFWAPESQFGSFDGVIRTRVGFAGEGRDSMEAVEMDFDPSIISYGELVQNFLNMNCTKGKSALVFARDSDDHKKIAANLLKGSKNVRLVSYTGFYRASYDHQKYILQRYPEIVKLINFPKGGEELIHSHLATKLNAYLGGNGNRRKFDQQVQNFGEIDPKILQMVRNHIR